MIDASIPTAPFSNKGAAYPFPQNLTLQVDGETYFAHVRHGAYHQPLIPFQKGPRREHTHAVHHLAVVTEGKGTFLVNGQLYPVRRGRLFVVSPHEPHDFNNGTGEHLKYCEVTFEFQTRDGRLLGWPLERILTAWTAVDFQGFREQSLSPEQMIECLGLYARMVRTGYARASGLEYELNDGLTRLLHWLVREFRSTGGYSSNPMHRIRDLLHASLHEPLSLDELAARCGFSANYVSRRFKAEFGETPIHYQLRLRMQTAAGLLLSPDYSIQQVAQAVGFEDPCFFSRMFKKHHGLPPAQYRRKQLGQSSGEKR